MFGDSCDIQCGDYLTLNFSQYFFLSKDMVLFPWWICLYIKLNLTWLFIYLFILLAWLSSLIRFIFYLLSSLILATPSYLEFLHTVISVWFPPSSRSLIKVLNKATSLNYWCSPPTPTNPSLYLDTFSFFAALSLPWSKQIT